MPALARVLLDGLVFPEGPRWHAGKLWFSDMRAHRVMTVDLAGRAETVEVPGQPSGLGWLPDGRLLVVSPAGNDVLRVREGGTVVDRVRVSAVPFACMLGGPDRRVLFVATAETHEPEIAKGRGSGRIEVATVDVPGAGLP